MSARTLVRSSPRPYRPLHSATQLSEAQKTTPSKHRGEGVPPDELEELLAKPTWSVESLLPPKTRAPDAPEITSKQLHHLLRLSALPLPETPEQEQKMLDTLAAQLHFVGEIQRVDTTGVKPLRAIRDETTAAEEEQTIGLDTLKEALAKEKTIGKWHRRIQRDTTLVDAKDVEDWDVLGSAEKKAGRFFFVESERPPE
jgi:Asp-tRNA(Asn)/Glu-tRNA(Gln) amidotransferase C subunit